MKPIYKQIVILSADRVERPAHENFRNNLLLEQFLNENKLSHGMVIGSYKGYRENSFLVEVENTEQVELLADKARDFSQEAILLLDEKRNAFLIDCTTRATDRIGKLINIPSSDVDKYDGWTYLPNAGEYFTVV